VITHDSPRALEQSEARNNDSCRRVRLLQQIPASNAIPTKRSPLRSAVVRIINGSEPPPGCGSVMTKAERTLPSTIGCSQRVFWASVATFFSTIMLPSSGARTVQRDRTEDRPIRFLVDRSHRLHTKAQPTARDGHLWRPQPCGLRLCARRLKRRLADVFVLVEVGCVVLHRQHRFGNEIAHFQA